MGMPEYRQIVEIFCRQAGIAEIGTALSQKVMTINGIPFWLEYLEQADICRVVVDLGSSEKGIPESILRAMLECNCSGNVDALPFIGISPSNGHAILMLHLPIAILQNDRGLLGILRDDLPDVFNIWQELFELSSSMDSERKISFPDVNHV